MCLLVIKLWLCIKRWLNVTDSFCIQVLLFFFLSLSLINVQYKYSLTVTF